ncbi:preprotein translocase subunit SecA [Candidatus Campbellbacteria bacterium]|nr:MAG: preprotein translocase subunit SecA [Candidatus Campbellbacteria bacterium]
MEFLSKLFGSDASRTLSALQPIVAQINGFEPAIEALSDEALRAKTTEFKERLAHGLSLEDILPEAFAVVREAARRTLKQRHYDVQLIGGIMLHRGAIAEMRTGEGKTLVETLPAYLNALTGKGVHIVTVNDYLARRDAVWMGQVFAFLGLSVGVVNSQRQSFLYDPAHMDADPKRDEVGSFKVVYEFLRPCEKRDAYAADITYGTNSEFGFDYLRDNTVYRKEDLSQRMPQDGGHHFAIVDEIDSILIDEARTPLIISITTNESEKLYSTFADIAQRLTEEEDYEVDEKKHAVLLTEAGIEKAEKILGLENIYTDAGVRYVHHLESAIKAKALYKKDKEYVVRDGEVIIVDEFTGRLQPGRRWSEGLHQAIEAKEGARIQEESRTLASITYQNYFRMYKKLAGMTGTAFSSSEEFFKVYGLDVVPIPTNRVSARNDHNDYIYQTEKGKFEAIAKRVKEAHDKGQPVLIGTVSIEKNELLSMHLTNEGIPHTVLNAKMHEQEGEVIAQAGRKGSVTVATNMAGRGVDIKLGGALATPEEHEEVKALGGLFVLGTERHEARRIDDQLRGRSGRQGDPGETQFFVSLEDSLMRVFASDAVKRMMGRFGIPEDVPIENRLINRSLEAAQKKIEGLNFDVRKHVLEFDDVMNTQRKTIYDRRKALVLGEHADIERILFEMIGGDEDIVRSAQEKKKELGDVPFLEAARRLMLQAIDVFWIDHLELMDFTRSSVNLRAYGQRDPLVEYQKEGLMAFRRMEASIEGHVMSMVPQIGAGAFSKEEEQLRRERARLQMIANDSSDAAPVQAKSMEHFGRNDMVTITNGTLTQEMKYKKAEPLIQSGEWKVVEQK